MINKDLKTMSKDEVRQESLSHFKAYKTVKDMPKAVLERLHGLRAAYTAEDEPKPAVNDFDIAMDEDKKNVMLRIIFCRNQQVCNVGGKGGAVGMRNKMKTKKKD